MKIAVYYNLNFGGAKRVVFEQIKELSKKHEVHIYKIDEDDDVFDAVNFAKEVYRYPSPVSNSGSSLKRLIYDFATYKLLPNLHRRIAQEIDSKKYDIVLVHPDKLTQAPFLLRFLKTKSVYYCQEPLRIAYEYSLRLKENVSFPKKLYEEINRMIRKNIDRVNVRAATYTIASCYYVRERMIEAYDVYPDINYPGIDVKQFRPMKRKKTNQVLFIGGKDVVTDGYDLAKAAVKRIPLIIRPKIHIVTWRKQNNQRLSDEELVQLYNESLLVLCVSRLETFGLVPLEAMACGVPVIATRVSGHRETVVDKKTGYLVEFSSEDIASLIIQLIKNDVLARKIGQNAVKYVKKYWNWEKSVSSLEGILVSYIVK